MFEPDETAIAEACGPIGQMLGDYMGVYVYGGGVTKMAGWQVGWRKTFLLVGGGHLPDELIGWMGIV
jgi:hypothetical protein